MKYWIVVYLALVMACDRQPLVPQDPEQCCTIFVESAVAGDTLSFKVTLKDLERQLVFLENQVSIADVWFNCPFISLEPLR